MEITELKKLYQKHGSVAKLSKLLEDGKIGNITLRGLKASSASVVVSELVGKANLLVVLDDGEQAGYFYNDLAQLCPEDNIDFLPSSYKRTIKYGIKDPANEILRTEVLTHLQSLQGTMCTVTYSEALAEKVVDKQALSDNTVVLRRGERHEMSEVVNRLLEIGFKKVDYVYEPGQMAVRGSLIDVYSYSSENPYRIDFWDDEIDSIKTFDVVDQLSKEKLEMITLVPIFESRENIGTSFFDFLPKDTVVLLKNKTLITEQVAQMSSWTFAKQALMADAELETVKLTDLVVSGDVFLQKVNALLNLLKVFQH